MTDPQLISRHSKGDEAAFADLVRRHGGCVYGVARRCVGDAHLAEDVTQAVFMVLARQGGRLRRGTVLPAWLFRVTRYASAKALRGDTRRRRH